MKQVLILGAGLVARPMVNYLLKTNEINVVLASRTVLKADRLIEGHSNGQSVHLTMDDDAKLENLVSGSEIVVSLLPYTFHLKVAKLCLKYAKPLVTTSYVSAAMKELDEEAREKGLLFLNEIGLDPGIDHMSAMRVMDNVKKRGGRIVSFMSYCGGFPAPEANDNPWGYKFSWSPRGVLMAGRNSARYLKDGSLVEIEGGDLFKNCWPIKIDGFQLETYPNRDSLPYREQYGINSTQTIFRGTLRYPGWCRTLLAVSELGMLKEDEITGTKECTYHDITRKILGIAPDTDAKNYICVRKNIEDDDDIIEKLEWLGLFSDQVYHQDQTTPLDFLTEIMQQKMSYRSGERDMVLLHHHFVAEFPDKTEYITSTLTDFGSPEGSSSMSRTVSLPAAIAVRQILNGNIHETGVRIPVSEEIYQPVLDELEQLNIRCREEYKVVQQNEKYS
ncbi:MAG: saccharopine dehydrogenase C-terminal domain-containing protein [Calditrichia bacterium]